MVRTAEDLFAIEKMAAQGVGNKMIATALGLPRSTTKHWLQRRRSDGEMVLRNVGRPRGAEARVCLVFLAFLVSHLSNFACFVRLFSGSDDENQEGGRAKMLINAWVATAPCCAVASVRKCLQASGIERGRVHEGRALASEAGDKC